MKRVSKISDWTGSDDVMDALDSIEMTIDGLERQIKILKSKQYPPRGMKKKSKVLKFRIGEEMRK